LPQLERIASEWLKSEWEQFASRGGVYLQDYDPKKNNNNKKNHNNNNNNSDNDVIVKQLIEMGFNRKVAIDAADCSSSLEEAIAIAMGDVPKTKTNKNNNKNNRRAPPPSTGTKSSLDSRKTSSLMGANYKSQFAEEAEAKKREFEQLPQYGFLVGMIEYLVI
jgi:hypothetical protein